MLLQKNTKATVMRPCQIPNTSLVLDNFDTSALEFMPGRDYLITNSTFIEGVYAALYYMIGFEE